MRRTLILSAAVAVLSACQSHTPEPLQLHDLEASARVLRGTIAANGDPVVAPIGVYEAMARAMRSNLDHRVAMMEADLARRDWELSGHETLPKVVASAGYFGRNNEAGSSSLSLLSGRQSLEPSTSLENEYYAGDLTASWNILDFGLSKVRAEQLGDEALAVEERRRKAVIGIMEDVHRAYWRAVSADRLSTRLAELEDDVSGAYQGSRRLLRSGRTSPMPALTFQRELNDIQGQAQALRREMAEAKSELAALMGLDPEVEFSIAVPERFDPPAELGMDMSTMIDVALVQRPEIREAALRLRISESEIRAASLQGLPSLEGFAGLNGSTNDFLFNQDWVSYGARVSWNLMELFETPVREKKARAGREVESARLLASAMAVMTQVAVSRLRYEALMNEYATSEEGARVQGRITELVDRQADAASASEQTRVRERMNAILAEARRDAVHAHMREAAAQVHSAMGYDPYPRGITGEEDLPTLTAAIEVLWAERASAPGL